MFVIFGASSSALTAAYSCAFDGEDVTIIEPTHRKWYMWNSGLTQTDRESTFINADTTALRWGALSEFQKRANVLAGEGATSKQLFFTNETVSSAMDDMMADFATRKTGKGVVTIVLNVGLQKVKKNPQNNAIESITCGGVVYEGMNFHDATDEGDLAAAAGCMMKLGRESSPSTMDGTSGVRSASTTSSRAANLTTGRRFARVFARSSKAIGAADMKMMAWNQRITVTDSDARIRWADITVPDYDPANYDFEYEVAKSENIGKMPASISGAPMKPVGTIPQLDMNNGGLVKIGSNWINMWLKWYSMTAWERINMLGEYTVHKVGLFKAICTDPRWAALPPQVVITRNAAGEITKTETFYIHLETAKYGLVSNTFVESPWLGDVDVSAGAVRANGNFLYICTRAGRTAATGGPTGKGVSILDGTGTGGAVWRFLRYYIQGMSPHMYVREGRRIVGEIDQQYDDVTAPEHDIEEPVTAYGYPHADAHWVNIYASELGFIHYEGGSGLAGDQEIVAAIMPWGALKANYADCPNLTVSRVTSGTKQGWLVSRLEMCYMKFGDVCGRAAARAKQKFVAANDNKPVYTGDLVYKTDLLPQLLAANAPIYVAKKAA